MKSKRFFVPLAVFTLVLLSVYALILHLALGKMPWMPTFLLFPYFFVLTLSIRHLTHNDRTGANGRKFVTAFMLASGLRFLASLGVLMAFVFLAPRREIIPLAFTFFGLYMAYLLFEILVRPKEKTPNSTP